ncbi:pentatricopeptide repeat-containing protein At1g08070, chloroplastic-like [Neltuma alba]|uniref:pentatricopeptide repeat-containing protein At1g08070, chloroplastic-like n=1 Tax=Neltuma alba TaxID=207710 RepID=UPI0010A369B0|nr:pentatricopeptide repeat-containing protein At1g08070, chloroplastic-like [Prosopis alba]
MLTVSDWYFAGALNPETRELQTALMNKKLASTVFPHLLEECLGMRELKQIHASAITHGLARFAYIASKILAFCAKSEHKDLPYAETLFNHMMTPNVFDFNSMIMGFSSNSEFDKVFSIFNRMPGLGVRPNARTFTFVVKSCVSCLYLNSLISGYCDNGLVNEARNLFDAIPQRNDVSYSAMVSGYVKNAFFNEGIELFREIKNSGNRSRISLF